MQAVRRRRAAARARRPGRAGRRVVARPAASRSAWSSPLLILLIAFGSALAAGIPIVMAVFGLGVGAGAHHDRRQRRRRARLGVAAGRHDRHRRRASTTRCSSSPASAPRLADGVEPHDRRRHGAAHLRARRAVRRRHRHRVAARASGRWASTTCGGGAGHGAGGACACSPRRSRCCPPSSASPARRIDRLRVPGLARRFGPLGGVGVVEPPGAAPSRALRRRPPSRVARRLGACRARAALRAPRRRHRADLALVAAGPTTWSRQSSDRAPTDRCSSPSTARRPRRAGAGSTTSVVPACRRRPAWPPCCLPRSPLTGTRGDRHRRAHAPARRTRRTEHARARPARDRCCRRRRRATAARTAGRRRHRAVDRRSGLRGRPPAVVHRRRAASMSMRPAAVRVPLAAGGRQGRGDERARHRRRLRRDRRSPRRAAGSASSSASTSRRRCRCSCRS